MMRVFDNLNNYQQFSNLAGVEKPMGGLTPEAQNHEEPSSHSSAEPLEPKLSDLSSDYAGAAGPSPANPNVTHLEGQSSAARSSDHAGAAGPSPVKGKGKQKENPIDANNSTSEFHAPGGSTGAAGPSTQKSDNFDSWLSSTPENVQKKYAKASDDQKAKMKENYQGVSDRLNRVGSEAKTLPTNAAARKQVEMNKQHAENAHKGGDFNTAKEYLGLAEEGLRNHAASNQAGPSTERKWPAKSDAVYPHKGKHRPGFNTTGLYPDAINSQIKKESLNGKPAKYNTSVASEVHKLEAAGYENGYDVNQGTTVHKFPQTIGASEGQLTPYIRLDGTDHGHPITQDQFNGYIQGEADRLRNSGGDTTQLSNYLNKIGENPQHFGI